MHKLQETEHFPCAEQAMLLVARRLADCFIGKAQHPSPSFESDARAAVVYDENTAAKERARQVLYGLRSVSFSQMPPKASGLVSSDLGLLKGVLKWFTKTRRKKL